MTFVTNKQELYDQFGLTPALIGELPIDVVLSEIPVYDFVVSEHPVETGESVNSSRYAKPVSVTIECIFTDPTFGPQSAGKKLLNGTYSLDTWRDKKDKLYEIKDSNKAFNLQTELDLYKDMVISSIIPNRAVQNTSAFFCRIVFTHVKFVTLEEVTVSEQDLPAKLEEKKTEKHEKAGDKGQGKNKKGKKTKDTSKEKNKSFLKQAKDAVADLF